MFLKGSDTALLKATARDAEKAAGVLESFIEKKDGGEDSVRAYRISVHSVKSSLLNIGETGLSQKAAALEQAAARGDAAALFAETPAFINDLRKIIAKINDLAKEPEEDTAGGISEDKADLLKKLDNIQKACGSYDIGFIYEATTELRKKEWTANTKKQLSEINNHLLHGDYDEVKNSAASFMSDISQVRYETASALINSEIDGLDILKGLARFDGNVKSYIKVLRSFTASLRVKLDVTETVTDETLREYEIAVHGIKGTCLDIFAGRLGEFAYSLENAAKEGDLEYIKANNGEFIKKTRELIKNIEDMLTVVIIEEPKPVKNKPDDEALIKLAEACKVYNMSAAEAAMAEIDKYQYDGDGGLAVWLREMCELTNYGDIVKRLSPE
jgi:HPt (histidine-containing phosphotransfer) domain-containing protein